MNSPAITSAVSNTFHAAMVDLNKAMANKGEALALAVSVGHAEYLEFDQFREAYKAEASADTWYTTSNYMAPLRRAWENKRLADWVELCRTQGIKAANSEFKAGEGKRGAPKNSAPVLVETVTVEAAPKAESVLSQADKLIAEAMREAEAEAVKAELEAVKAELEAVKAELEAVKAELEAVKAEKAAKPRKLKAAA